MPSIDIKLGETWSLVAQAYDEVANLSKTFVHPPTWATSDNAKLPLFSISQDATSCQIRGDAVGTFVLSVSSDGVETDLTVNVKPPFDNIRVTATKV